MTDAFAYSEMYWTDWGDQPEIAKANMDGSDDKSLVTDNIHWPNGLAIDYPNERLYWVDAKYQSIESVQLDGSFRKVLTPLLSWSRFYCGHKRKR